VTSISLQFSAIRAEYAYSDGQQANANGKRREDILAEPILIGQLASEQSNCAEEYD